MTIKNIFKNLSYSLFFLFAVLLSFSTQANINPDLLKQAEQGDASAQYSVGRHYEIGKRVKSDPNKAIHWYTRAADQGNLEASYRLGLIYYKGAEGVPADLAKAFRYMTRAAEGNYKRSQTHLAKMYENGDGVEKNETLSDYWYEQAFNDDIQPLKEFLKERQQDDDVEEDMELGEPANIKPSPASVKKPVAKAVVDTAKISFPETILAHRWFQFKKPAEYIRSKLVSCKQKNEKLICTSKKIQGSNNAGVFRYKVRSIITETQSPKGFVIVYRRLYVTVPGESIGGYDDIDEKKSEKALKLGWEESSHRVPCQYESEKKILCQPVGEDAFYFTTR